jgi:ribose transport system permease protein
MAPFVSLVVLTMFFTFTAKGFLSQGTLVQVLKEGSSLGVVAVGLTFVLLCGEIDLAVGNIAVFGACFAGWLFQRTGVGSNTDAPFTLGVVGVVAVALLSCLALGLITGILTNWTRLPSFIISLAMMYIALGAAQYLTRGNVQPMPTGLKVLGSHGIRLARGFELPYVALLATVVFLGGHFVLRYTRFGRYIYATGGNRQAARLNGIRTDWIMLACMGISGVAAGMAGILTAGDLSNASLDQNADLLLSAVACVVLGGTSLFGGEGGMGRTAIGVLTFTVLHIGLNQISWIDNFARTLLMGVVLLSALVLNGLLAKRRR